MDAHSLRLAIALDLPTLFVIAIAVSGLLGLFLLLLWHKERGRALAWWGSAYLLGGFSVTLWCVEGVRSSSSGLPETLLFIACGMIWSAARLFHGRPVLWVAMLAGAAVWLLAGAVGLADSAMQRVVLSSLIVSAYMFLTAQELWRERRKSLIRPWPAVFVPVLHGLVFLAPVPIAALMPDESGLASLAGGWIAVFLVEAILYSVGVAFIVVVLGKERASRVERNAAFCDPLTGLFNRRGFVEGARKLKAAQNRRREPIAALIFDLDHFKSINDRFGHFVGDEVLVTFAATMNEVLRADDLIARFGGEEFVVLLRGDADDAAVAGERVRAAFEAAGKTIGSHEIGATVSVGVAAAAPTVEIAALLIEADTALYRAKAAGRNCVVKAAPHDRPTDAELGSEARSLAEARATVRWGVDARSQEAGTTNNIAA